MFLLLLPLYYLKPNVNEISHKMLKKIILLSLLLFSIGCKSKKQLLISKDTTLTKLNAAFKKYENTPYKYGGISEKGFDCSGFVYTVYKNTFSINLPRTTSQMKNEGKKIKKSALKPGDLIFFRPKNSYNHVGIYLEKGIMIHSSTSKGVIKTNINNAYWKKYYHSSRRILP